ncbi:MAG: hypothetical protein N2999_03675 [Proteobacteria bacterium]|nr:hypothetical protein [Pseudomonadota bacterium]
MKSVIILDSEYLLHLCGELRKGQYFVGDLHKVRSKEKKVYERTEKDVLLNYDVLKGLIEELKNKSLCKLKESCVILPHALSWYHYLEVETYPKNENEAIEFVMWKIQKIMPIPKDYVEIRIQLLKKEKEVTKLLIVATFKGFLKSLENLLIELGVEPVLMITPSLSFMNVFEKSLPRNGVVYWLREKDFSQIIIKDDLPISIREVDRPLELSRIDFETMSMLTNIRERFGDFEPQEMAIFDEMERIGIENYFSEKVKVLNIKEKLLNPSEELKVAPYVCGLGVLDL